MDKQKADWWLCKDDLYQGNNNERQNKEKLTINQLGIVDADLLPMKMYMQW